MANKVIKLSATWCGPCKQYAPMFDSFRDNLIGAGWEVQALDIDTNEGKEVAQQYGVRSVPTTIILEEGKEALVKVGVIKKAEFGDLVGL
jgi:thiol-disulfide isomerase/thioredoxin